jgi:Protein of unknown function (DUF3551)
MSAWGVTIELKIRWRSENLTGDTKMRIFIVIAAVAGTTLIGTNPSRAVREEPWCVKANVGGGTSIDYCYYRTFEQCSQARFNYFSSALCVHNPHFLPYWTRGEAPPPRKAREMHNQ